MLIMFLKLIYFIFFVTFVSSQEWSYGDLNNWRRTFSSCGGRRQSPININSDRLRRNPSLRLNLNSFETPHRNVILRNTGHSAEMTLNPRSPRMTITVGQNAVPYVFQNMHFHWGQNNIEGSEHSVDNSFGSAEIHFVHYNEKYGSLSAAQNRKDGIVVVTVLMRLSRENNRALEPIIRSLSEMINVNSSAIIRQYNFGRLLPRDTRLFFTYSGSLTTPPCSEAVTWMIFADPIRISALQLSQFRRLFEESKGRNGQRLVSNTRNVQQLHGRAIEISVPQGRRTLSNEPRSNEGDNFDNDVDENSVEDDSK